MSICKATKSVRGGNLGLMHFRYSRKVPGCAACVRMKRETHLGSLSRRG